MKTKSPSNTEPNTTTGQALKTLAVKALAYYDCLIRDQPFGTTPWSDAQSDLLQAALLFGAEVDHQIHALSTNAAKHAVPRTGDKRRS